MKKLFTAILLYTAVAGCHSNNKKSSDDGFTTDTSIVVHNNVTDNTGAFNHRDSSYITAGTAERLKKRALIYMGIDSTYYAIEEIEDIKNEMNDESAVGYSLAERNMRSKALLKLNMIENALARQVDSALLVNLKIHTAQLEHINEKMSVDITHLKDLSDKLDRATKIVNRLTTLLTVCVSSGFIKPPTPVSSTPAEVKATMP